MLNGVRSWLVLTLNLSTYARNAHILDAQHDVTGFGCITCASFSFLPSLILCRFKVRSVISIWIENTFYLRWLWKIKWCSTLFIVLVDGWQNEIQVGYKRQWDCTVTCAFVVHNRWCTVSALNRNTALCMVMWERGSIMGLWALHDVCFILMLKYWWEFCSALKLRTQDSIIFPCSWLQPLLW
jgi:hypothetical protein